MSRSTYAFALVLAFGLGLSGTAAAQNAKARLNEVVRETQKQGIRAGRITLVWWLPAEFWRVALTASGTVPAETVEQMVGTISDVNVFIAVDAKVGADASMTFASPADLEKNLSIIDPEGKPIAVIPENKQSAAARNLIAVMKPVFSSMIGELGKSLAFFVYEGKKENGTRRVDPAKSGYLTARLGVEEFKWRLPLGSLLPVKMCPKCKETFPGNYAFCPYDGARLKESAAEKK